MKALEILGALMGIGIIFFPLSAIGITIYELTKSHESRSFFIPILFIVLFLVCSIGLVVIVNITDKIH
ncbi:hypothetical protein RW115_12400 [Macrococcus capreoli]